jgi:hypothetical protein
VYAYEIESWDELSVPLSFLMPAGDVPIVTVYTNCAAPPLPSPRRCREVDAFVGDCIRGRASPERIALVATGGLSHWGGHARDRAHQSRLGHRVLDHITRGDTVPLTRLTSSDIERDGGNGGQEIRNWIALMGAVPGWKGGAAGLRAGGGVDHRLRHRGGPPVTPAVSYALNELLTDIARQHQMRERVSDEEMAGHALSEPERAALRAGDVGRLYEPGANPYLIRPVFRPRFTIYGGTGRGAAPSSRRAPAGRRARTPPASDRRAGAASRRSRR